MVDAAAEFRRRGTPVWFVAPEPRRPFPSGALRPTMASLIRELSVDVRPVLVAPRVGVPFELGTRAYRSSVYERAVSRAVPPGTHIVVSDDDAVWSAAAAVSASHPMVGVLHSDEQKYYDLVHRHRAQLAACVAVSQRISRTALALADVTAEPIPCGVPMRPLLPVSDAQDSVNRLVWIGRIEDAQKRVSDLPLIAEHLRSRGIRYSLSIVGDGPERDQILAAVATRGLQEIVHFLGWRNSQDIWTLLNASDVLVLPSNFEGMPMVVMEALAAGCSVVATQVSGIEDVDEHAHPGRPLRTYPVGNVQDAAVLIAQAIEQPRATRRRDARAMASQLFSIGVCIDRYEQLLARSRAGRNHVRGRHLRFAATGMASLPIAAARALRRSLHQRSA
jgi:glycosyltransferase involved in cell wall biosynthesis